MTALAAIPLIGVGKIALFVFVISVLIVLHEYGHFILARLFGVRVLEFAVGMGPRVGGWTSARSGTMYSLRAFPIGGYCAMYGEDAKASEAEQQRQYRDRTTYEQDNFQARGPWSRLAIIAAGPIANFILCLLILFVAAVSFGVQSSEVQPRIGPLQTGMPAQKAGLHAGDRILSVNGKTVAGGDQLVTTIHNSLHKPLRITFNHNGNVSSVTVTPIQCPQTPKPVGCLGFYPVAVYERVSLRAAAGATVANFAQIAQQTFGSLSLLVRHPREYGSQVSGVVGMGQAAMTIQDFGWGPYFFFAALISFALGVFNLLPLPALDGGRAAFVVAELVRGKPVDPEKEALVHIAGFAVLIALMVWINLYNVLRITQGKGPF